VKSFILLLGLALAMYPLHGNNINQKIENRWANRWGLGRGTEYSGLDLGCQPLSHRLEIEQTRNLYLSTTATENPESSISSSYL